MKLNREYIFQNYLVGDNNKAVIDALSSAMISPGRIHNPIFIYGAIGIGKTHLLQALAKEYKAEYKICYITAEELVNGMVEALQNRRYADFLKQILKIDALFVEDIDLVKNKKSTLEELSLIFKCLYNARKQVIITADRPAMRIFKKNGKAGEIFQKGLTLKLKRPGVGERLKFLRAKAQDADLQLGNDILEDLARKGRPDFRELKGTLAKASFLP